MRPRARQNRILAVSNDGLPCNGVGHEVGGTHLMAPPNVTNAKGRMRFRIVFFVGASCNKKNHTMVETATLWRDVIRKNAH